MAEQNEVAAHAEANSDEEDEAMPQVATNQQQSTSNVKKKSYTLEFKLKCIEFAKKKTNSEAARKFGVDRK